MKKTIFSFLHVAMLTMFVFSGKKADSNSHCSTSKDGGTFKGCGCSTSFRTDGQTYNEETLKNHQTLEWTESNPPKQYGGLKYGSMVHLQGGEFLMGTNSPKIISDGEGPARQIQLNAFYMDQHEVCNHDFELFVNKTGYVTEVS